MFSKVQTDFAILAMIYGIKATCEKNGVENLFPLSTPTVYALTN